MDGLHDKGAVQEAAAAGSAPAVTAAAVAGPPLAPAGAGTSAIFERLERLLADGQSEMLRELRDQLARDRFKEQQIERLHQELQAHKSDLLGRAVRPLLLGLIRIHDNLGKVQSSLLQVAPAELTAEKVAATFDGFREDLEILLADHGVVAFEAPGARFDPHCQTAARTVPIANPDRVGDIAARLRPGFAIGEAPIQKERVAVYVAAADDPTS